MRDVWTEDSAIRVTREPWYSDLRLSMGWCERESASKVAEHQSHNCETADADA